MSQDIDALLESEYPSYNKADEGSGSRGNVDELNVRLMAAEDEVVRLRAELKKCSSAATVGNNLLKEYEALTNYFPPRGEKFCIGKIEKNAASGKTYNVEFSSQFSEPPKVMVCVLYPKVIKIDASNIEVTPTYFKFTVSDSTPALADGSFYFWIAFVPMKVRNDKLQSIFDKLKGVRQITEKEIESAISVYKEVSSR